jgi:transmembrane sensor
MTTPQATRNRADHDDVLHQEARIWLARLSGGDVRQVDLQAFRRWQGKSAAHAEAFDDAKRQWHAMRPAIGEWLRADPEAAARHRRLASHGVRPEVRAHGNVLASRRAFLGVGLGAAAAAGVAAVYPPLGLWPSVGTWSADYRTATGEQRDISLASVAGRVDVVLNTQTSVRRQTRDGRTDGLDLLTGEVAVDLASAREPFAVVAGAGRSVAQAGRFEVRYLDGRVCVSCLEGAVRVRHPAGERRLAAREQTVYRDDVIGGVTGVEPAAVSAWRRGELVFRQTPLAKVIDEINRYRPGRVVLLAESRRGEPVSGRFSIAILNEALLQIERSFGLTSRTLPGGVLILS